MHNFCYLVRISQIWYLKMEFYQQSRHHIKTSELFLVKSTCFASAYVRHFIITKTQTIYVFKETTAKYQGNTNKLPFSPVNLSAYVHIYLTLVA